MQAEIASKRKNWGSGTGDLYQEISQGGGPGRLRDLFCTIRLPPQVYETAVVPDLIFEGGIRYRGSLILNSKCVFEGHG